MSPLLATMVYVAGIMGLFWLDRDRKSQLSYGFWIPTLWLLINGSRQVSLWFATPAAAAQAQENLEGSPLDAAIYGVLIMAGIVVLSVRRRKAVSLLRLNLPIVFFFAYSALSVVWSDYSFVASKRWVKAIGDLVMVLVVLTEANPRLAIRKWLSRTAFILLPVSVLLIKYWPNLGRAYNPWTWEPMYGGVTTFKNLLGMTCLVCGLGSLWSLGGAWRDRQMPDRKRHLAAHALVLACLFWLLHIANSMTALSCFGMAGTLIVFTGQRSSTRRVRAAHLLVWGCVALAICALFIDPSTFLPGLGRDATLTGRTVIWEVVLSMHTNPLVGTGFESFWMGDRLQHVWMLTEKGIEEAHNGYLELYLNLGWIGIALLGAMIVTGYRNCVALLQRDPEAARIRLAFFSASLIYSMTEAGFRMMSPIWIMFLLSITATAVRPKRTARSISGSKTVWAREDSRPDHAADLPPSLEEPVETPRVLASVRRMMNRAWSAYGSFAATAEGAL